MHSRVRKTTGTEITHNYVDLYPLNYIRYLILINYTCKKVHVRPCIERRRRRAGYGQMALRVVPRNLGRHGK